jgi:hypothetical protein
MNYFLLVCAGLSRGVTFKLVPDKYLKETSIKKLLVESNDTDVCSLSDKFEGRIRNCPQAVSDSSMVAGSHSLN